MLNREKTQLSKIAFEELNKLSDARVIDKSIYLPWLKKYGNLYDTYKSHSPFHTSARFFVEQEKFHTLYQKINELAIFLSYEVKYLNALSEFRSIDPNNILAIADWESKYENLKEEQLEMHLFVIDNIMEPNMEHFLVNGLKINAKDFKHQIEFVLTYP